MKKNNEQKEPLFSITKRTYYKDGIFEAGLVKNSPHKVNQIYLRIGEMFFHLRDDEAFVILECLSKALWCEAILRRNNFKDKIKWFPLKKIVNDKIRKPEVITLKSIKEGVYLTMKKMK